MSSQSTMDVTRFVKAGVPDTLLPTYGWDPRRPDGLRASGTVPMFNLPDCLNPRKMRLPMQPPVFYYGYEISDAKIMEITGHIRGGERENGKINMGMYACMARPRIAKRLGGWTKFPLERVFGSKGLIIVFCTNYSDAQTKASTEQFMEPARQLLGITEEPKWYLAVHNRWYWA